MKNPLFQWQVNVQDQKKEGPNYLQWVGASKRTVSALTYLLLFVLENCSTDWPEPHSNLPGQLFLTTIENKMVDLKDYLYCFQP